MLDEINQIKHRAAYEALDQIAVVLEREGLVSKNTSLAIRNDDWYSDSILEIVKEIMNEHVGDVDVDIEDRKNPPANPEPTYR